jgi:hypothetical protein
MKINEIGLSLTPVSELKKQCVCVFVCVYVCDFKNLNDAELEKTEDW